MLLSIKSDSIAPRLVMDTMAYVIKALDSIENVMPSRVHTGASNLTFLEITLSFLFIAGSFLFLVNMALKKWWPRYATGLDAESKKNIVWMLVIIFILVIYFGVLSLYKAIIHEPLEYDFFISKADALVVVGIIIGFVGAIWAVKARVDASKAFNKSEETFNALGNSFSFHEIGRTDRLPFIIDQIGKSNTSINLYIGFPCIGYLYAEKAKFTVTPESLLNNLNGRLADLTTRINAGNVTKVKLTIRCFNYTQTISYLKGNKIEMNSIDLIESFYLRLSDLKKLNGINENFIDIKEYFDEKEKIRFVSIQTDIDPKINNKTLMWIVPKLDPAAPNITTFDSAAFQTNNSDFAKIMEIVATQIELP